MIETSYISLRNDLVSFFSTQSMEKVSVFPKLPVFEVVDFLCERLGIEAEVIHGIRVMDDGCQSEV